MFTLRDFLKALDEPVGEMSIPGAGPWNVGTKYLIRTVTNYWVGELVAVYPMEIVLKTAAWVADTGRYTDCLLTGHLSEIEPVLHGHVIIGRGSIDDAVQWLHDLPREQK